MYLDAISLLLRQRKRHHNFVRRLLRRLRRRRSLWGNIRASPNKATKALHTHQGGEERETWPTWPSSSFSIGAHRTVPYSCLIVISFRTYGCKMYSIFRELKEKQLSRHVKWRGKTQQLLWGLCKCSANTARWWGTYSLSGWGGGQDTLHFASRCQSEWRKQRCLTPKRVSNPHSFFHLIPFCAYVKKNSSLTSSNFIWAPLSSFFKVPFFLVSTAKFGFNNHLRKKKNMRVKMPTRWQLNRICFLQG